MSEHAVILNVDDDEAGRFAVTHILRRAGFEVHEAGTGEEGLRLARAVQPDLMLLDIVLPDIDGFEVCRLLKGDPATSGISIIHLSAGRTAGHDKAVGLEGGADAYLTEPVGEEELVATVRTFLRIRRAEAGQRLMADRFRSALEAAELGTFDHDLVSGERNWDQRLRALLGLQETDPVDEPGALAAVHPDDWAALLGARAAAFDPAQRAPAALEVRVGAPTYGRWIRIHGAATFVGERPVRFVGTVMDVTAQKTAELEVVRRAEFERQLVGIVSHDLRNPLQVIGMSAAQLMRTEAQRPSLRHVQRITATVERMNRMIGQLLDFTQARLGSGIRVAAHPAHLHAIVAGVVEDMQVAFPERHFDVEQMGDDRGVWDEDRIAQVLVNLFGNAVNHSPADAAVRVRVYPSPDGDEMLVEVKNANIDGPIAPAAMQVLFEPFERGESGGAPRARGLGLGLYIVDQIVKGHRGRIEARSTESDGTTFTVHLPRTGATGS